MDNRNAKRPRTPTKGGEPPPKKKSKSSKKKTKRTRTNSESELKKSTASLHSTSTADGQMMAQMLSTFSKLEQSRFEAFRRSTVPADAVHEWLAACLADRYSIPPPAANGGAGESRTLADLVQPGQADSISMVVATLAKVYAQRLVSEAQRLAMEDSNNSNNNEGVTTADELQYPLQPQHIRRAWEHRKRQGLDPGFFLQANEGLQWSSGGQATGVHDCRRLAALAAQEEYDAHVAEEEKKEKDARRDEMDLEPSSLEADAATTDPNANTTTTE